MGFLRCLLAVLAFVGLVGSAERAEARLFEIGVEIEDGAESITVGSGETIELQARAFNNFELEMEDRWSTSSSAATITSTTTNFFMPSASFVAPTVTVETEIVVTVEVNILEGEAVSDTIIVRVRPAKTPVPEEVAAFQTQRINALMQEQPDLASVFDGAAGPVVMASTMGDGLAVSIGQGGPVWAEVRGNRSVLEGVSGSYVLGAVGTHWQLSEGVVVGLMAMADRMETAGITGTGWLAGPYAVFRAEGQPLVFQARYLQGDSRNRLADGTVYGSRRSLAMLGLSGSLTRGTVEIVPSLRASYGREVSDEIALGKGLLAPSVVTELAQVETGLAVAFPIDLGAGETRLRLGLSDIWTDGSAALDGHRGEVSVMLRHRTSAGGELTLRLARDGLGMAGYKATRAAVNFSLPF